MGFEPVGEPAGGKAPGPLADKGNEKSFQGLVDSRKVGKGAKLGQLIEKKNGLAVAPGQGGKEVAVRGALLGGG
jgi:hypothetical protein